MTGLQPSSHFVYCVLFHRSTGSLIFFRLCTPFFSKVPAALCFKLSKTPKFEQNGHGSPCTDHLFSQPSPPSLLDVSWFRTLLFFLVKLSFSLFLSYHRYLDGLTFNHSPRASWHQMLLPARFPRSLTGFFPLGFRRGLFFYAAFLSLLTFESTALLFFPAGNWIVSSSKLGPALPPRRGTKRESALFERPLIFSFPGCPDNVIVCPFTICCCEIPAPPPFCKRERLFFLPDAWRPFFF